MVVRKPRTVAHHRLTWVGTALQSDETTSPTRARPGTWPKKGFLSPFRVLVENRSARQTITKNAVWLGLGQGITGALNFLLNVLLIRAFGATTYGSFVLALSYVMLFSTLFDFGLASAVTREFAAKGTQQRVFASVLGLRLLLGAAVIVLLIGSSFIFVTDPQAKRLVGTLAAYIFLVELANLFYANLRAQQRMEVEAFFRLLHIGLLVGAVAGVLVARPSLANVSFAYLATGVIVATTIFAWTLFRRSVGAVAPFAFDPKVWRAFLLLGGYLALAKGVGDVLTYVDSVLLGAFGRLTEVGFYNAAARVNALLLFPMAIVASAVFPALVGLRQRSESQFRSAWATWLRGSIYLASMLALLVFVAAPELVALAYGEAVLPAALALRILILTAWLVYVHSVFYHVLLIHDLQREVFFAMAMSMALNIALNLLLIPRYGMIGSAWASVTTHALTLLQLIVLTVRRALTPLRETRFFPSVLAAGLAVSVAAGALWYTRGRIEANVFLTLLIAATSYMVALFLFDWLLRITRGRAANLRGT